MKLPMAVGLALVVCGCVAKDLSLDGLKRRMGKLRKSEAAEPRMTFASCDEGDIVDKIKCWKEMKAKKAEENSSDSDSNEKDKREKHIKKWQSMNETAKDAKKEMMAEMKAKAEAEIQKRLQDCGEWGQEARHMLVEGASRMCSMLAKAKAGKFDKYAEMMGVEGGAEEGGESPMVAMAKEKFRKMSADVAEFDERCAEEMAADAEAYPLCPGMNL